jgi:hypothetical protein
MSKMNSLVKGYGSHKKLRESQNLTQVIVTSNSSRAQSDALAKLLIENGG